MSFERSSTNWCTWLLNLMACFSIMSKIMPQTIAIMKLLLTKPRWLLKDFRERNRRQSQVMTQVWLSSKRRPSIWSSPKQLWVSLGEPLLYRNALPSTFSMTSCSCFTFAHPTLASWSCITKISLQIRQIKVTTFSNRLLESEKSWQDQIPLSKKMKKFRL